MDVDFILPDPSYEEHSWILQEEHGPAAQLPLIVSTRLLASGATQPGTVPAALFIKAVPVSDLKSGPTFTRR